MPQTPLGQGPNQPPQRGRMTIQDERRKRLAEALRDNLKRRKAQNRNRRNSAVEQGDSERPEPGLKPAPQE